MRAGANDRERELFLNFCENQLTAVLTEGSLKQSHSALAQKRSQSIGAVPPPQLNELPLGPSGQTPVASVSAARL